MDKEGFGQALRFHLSDQAKAYPWLAGEVTKRTNRATPLDGSTVARWAHGESVPEPAYVFAVEEALGLSPGTLSALLGYLPVGSDRAELSVPAAVDADPQLTVMGRRVILKVYEELVADGADGP